MELRRVVVLAFLALPAGASADASCLLGGPTTDSAACATCHTGDHGRAHPVGVDYALATLRKRGGLRPAPEVVGRGVFLPDGRVQCVSCHDPASPWGAKLALPPGAPVVPAVISRVLATNEARPSWRTAGAADAGTVPPGAAVSPAPLCAACHTMGD